MTKRLNRVEPIRRAIFSGLSALYHRVPPGRPGPGGLDLSPGLSPSGPGLSPSQGPSGPSRPGLSPSGSDPGPPGRPDPVGLG